jgi:hypothetical protein
VNKIAANGSADAEPRAYAHEHGLPDSRPLQFHKALIDLQRLINA